MNDFQVLHSEISHVSHTFKLSFPWSIIRLNETTKKFIWIHNKKQYWSTTILPRQNVIWNKVACSNSWNLYQSIIIAAWLKCWLVWFQPSINVYNPCREKCVCFHQFLVDWLQAISIKFCYPWTFKILAYCKWNFLKHVGQLEVLTG